LLYQKVGKEEKARSRRKKWKENEKNGKKNENKKYPRFFETPKKSSKTA
jgi:hypothetical protein